MYSVIGRFVVWTAAAIAAELIVKKSGIVEKIEEIGKAGSGQERKKKSAIDDLDLSKAKDLEEDDFTDSNTGC
jgi:hypothetical protein